MQFDAVAYINEPRWQNVRMGLDRIEALLERMGRPQDKLKFVHVAGTNGKGSTCAYIARILQEAGYRCGLFTSPYIIEFEERIRINGVNIPKDELQDVTLFVREHAEAIEKATGEHPTEFELMTAVAFEYFARSTCDIVVCEVGLGGRLDSTNIIENPELCVITRIALDHTDLLGDTIEKIASEKLGIVKPGASVVLYPQDCIDIEGARADFDKLEIGPVGADGLRRFTYCGHRYETKLLGTYQPMNASVAIEAIRALQRRGWNIPEDAIDRGIAGTSWPGRFELYETTPVPIIIDGGHNPQGARVLAESLQDVFPGRPIVFVMGVLADKNYPAMIDAVSHFATYFICATPPNPRALSADDLAAAIQARTNIEAEAAKSYPSALERAREVAQKTPNSIICAFGSLYAISSLNNQ